jgi:iron-sulfur cluster repair protein YtfE (RIC family)
MNHAVAADQDLLLRDGLPGALRPLAAQLPRAAWQGDSKLAGQGSMLIEIHDMLRAKFVALVGSGQTWSGQGDTAAYRRSVLPKLSDLFNILEFHHRAESEFAFPKMAAVDPRTRAAFDLLNLDHQVIHALMENAWRNALAFNSRAATEARSDIEAAALMESIERMTTPFTRHLLDEEDIVIPHLARHGFQY